MSQSPIKLNANQPITNADMSPTYEFLQYITKVSGSLTLVGLGTPEGTLSALQYTIYVDETAPLTPITYRKMLVEIGGDRSKGWVVV